MPRPKRKDDVTIRNIRVNSDLDAKVAILIADPLTGKPTYGEYSKLVESLLRKWVDDKIRQAV